MRIESKLCHISENKAIVQVTGWINGKTIGSALAEGTTVEVAEDKAISRLNIRVHGVGNNEESLKSTQLDKLKNPIKVDLPKNEKIEKINKNEEPSDWSNELTAIDAEIQRLKWTRDDEIVFLQKTLGYNNRNKITTYSDLVKYLSLLKNTDSVSLSNVINRNINNLIVESDTILRELSWDRDQGREYLKSEFNVSTRMELNEKQLISFVDKLKSIRNKYLSQ
tara:strand:- start:2304 stop:2972 length:669 start_codon:yes stop_codon:yes gene_type:complete